MRANVVGIVLLLIAGCGGGGGGGAAGNGAAGTGVAGTSGAAGAGSAGTTGAAGTGVAGTSGGAGAGTAGAGMAGTTGAGGGSAISGSKFVRSYVVRMAAHAGTLYFISSEPQGYALKSAPLTGAADPPSTTLFADTTMKCSEQGMSADANGVYWTSLCDPQLSTQRYAIRKCPLPAGCAAGPTILRANVAIARGNAIGGGFVFWVQQSSDWSVHKLPLDGSSISNDVVFQMPADRRFGNPYQIATDGTDVAWSTSGVPIAVGYVGVCPIAGCPAEANIPKIGMPAASPVALGPGKVVYVESSTKIVAAARDGTNPVDLAAGSASALAVDGSNVYILARGPRVSGPTTLLKCALDGCGGAPTVLATDAQSGVFDLVVDGGHVYYLSAALDDIGSAHPDAGWVMRVAK
jgi:hypothetical protein